MSSLIDRVFKVLAPQAPEELKQLVIPYYCAKRHIDPSTEHDTHPALDFLTSVATNFPGSSAERRVALAALSKFKPKEACAALAVRACVRGCVRAHACPDLRACVHTRVRPLACVMCVPPMPSCAPVRALFVPPLRPFGPSPCPSIQGKTKKFKSRHWLRTAVKDASLLDDRQLLTHVRFSRKRYHLPVIHDMIDFIVSDQYIEVRVCCRVR